MRKTLGLIVGRFQHLHVGHVEMIKKGLEACDKVLLLIGSTQESGTIRNPFSFSDRYGLIQIVFKEEIKEGKLFLGGIDDLTNEHDHSLEWGDHVLETVNTWRSYHAIKEPLQYMIYGNDEERKKWYREEDIVNVEQIILERSDTPISATKMREFLVRGDKKSWDSFMPKDRLSKETIDIFYVRFREMLLQVYRRIEVKQLSGRKMDELIGEKVMGLKGLELMSEFLPHYSENMQDAMMVANKLGICLIPQSKEDAGFHWFACDIEKVSYTGESVSVYPIEDTEISASTPALAICKAALLSIGEDDWLERFEMKIESGEGV